MSDWLDAARRITESHGAEMQLTDGTWTKDFTVPEEEVVGLPLAEVVAEPEGVLLDLFTASMLVQVYDALTIKENKEKFAAMPLLRAVQIGWQLVEKTKTA